MAWKLFHTFLEKQEDGNAVNLETDTIKMMLINSTRAPVQATDTDMATIDNNEVSGGGYTAGGPTLANKTVTLNSGTVTVDADDVTFSQNAGGFTNARYAVLYKSTGTPANDTPIAYEDFGADKGNVSGDLVIEMSANGIFTKTTS
jgi:hypothetical protein